jgi:hypothetical protein
MAPIIIRAVPLLWLPLPDSLLISVSLSLSLQGGFLVIKPSLTDYQRLVSIVMEGHYKGSSAWGGTKIGWFWGGKTIQGLLAYYYQHVQDRGRGLRVDRCIYNTMADSDRCR